MTREQFRQLLCSYLTEPEYAEVQKGLDFGQEALDMLVTVPDGTQFKVIIEEHAP